MPLISKSREMPEVVVVVASTSGEGEACFLAPALPEDLRTLLGMGDVDRDRVLEPDFGDGERERATLPRGRTESLAEGK